VVAITGALLAGAAPHLTAPAAGRTHHQNK